MRRDRRRTGGFAIPLVMMFLVALTILAGTATLLTTRELRTSGRFQERSRAYEVAASGLERGVERFAERGDEPSAWPLSGRVDGTGYRVSIARDSFDFGGGVRPVSIDDRGVHNGDGRGDPIHVVTSTAGGRAVQSVHRLWLAPHVIPRLPAALTVNGGGTTVWRGDALISGLDASGGGGPSGSIPADACAGDRPALHQSPADASAPLLEHTVRGHSGYATASPPYTTRGPAPGADDVDRVLDEWLPRLAGAARRGLAHHFSRPPSLSGVTWITDRAGGPAHCLTSGGCADIEGSGILIVHNPRYDPREHDPDHARYDPVKALSPLHQPARLDDLSGGTFRGLVVVDRLPGRATGSFVIEGALVELWSGSSHRVVEWPAGAAVQYSCETLLDATRAAGLGPERLAWIGS